MAELCAGLAGHGIDVIRDLEAARPGDRISEFIARLGAGRCVLVVLSADYLRSVYCMTELYLIWNNARRDDKTFLRRIVPLIQDDAAIGTPAQRIDHATDLALTRDRPTLRQDNFALIKALIDRALA